MAGYESQGCLSLYGIPNFYKVMFFISLILLVFAPGALITSVIWLESREIVLDGRVTALEAEIESLEQMITGQRGRLESLEAEVLEIARAEQVFSGESQQGSLWGPDTRWSEMGRARVEEIWRRHEALEERLAESQASVREKRADLVMAQAGKRHIAHFSTFVSDRRVALYGLMLLGAFTTVLFGLLWGSLVQAKVNAILTYWTRK